MAPATIRPKDLTGYVFGRLTVIAPTDRRVGKYVVWRCTCECGAEHSVSAGSLHNGSSRSCGCLRRDVATTSNTTHGANRTRGHQSWIQMLNRCRNPRATGFEHWGGRGITVCERWLRFENFLADMGPRPKGLSLERLDNNKNYEPGNCKWATRTEQCRNRSTTTSLTFQGETRCITEWARLLGMRPATLWARIKHGWSTERALTAPVRDH